MEVETVDHFQLAHDVWDRGGAQNKDFAVVLRRTLFAVRLQILQDDVGVLSWEVVELNQTLNVVDDDQG